MEPIYFSVDIEADGPIPGPYSMLSLGCAALSARSGLLGTFRVNCDLLEGADQHPETMKWWEKFPAAYHSSRQNCVPPDVAMREFSRWIDTLGTKSRIFLGYPASYDFMFVHWYFVKFLGYDPFGFAAMDAKSFAACRYGLPFSEISKEKIAEIQSVEIETTHDALADAIGQGKMFLRMLETPAKT